MKKIQNFFHFCKEDFKKNIAKNVNGKSTFLQNRQLFGISPGFAKNRQIFGKYPGFSKNSANRQMQIFIGKDLQNSANFRKNRQIFGNLATLRFM